MEINEWLNGCECCCEVYVETCIYSNLGSCNTPGVQEPHCPLSLSHKTCSMQVPHSLYQEDYSVLRFPRLLALSSMACSTLQLSLEYSVRPSASWPVTWASASACALLYVPHSLHIRAKSCPLTQENLVSSFFRHKFLSRDTLPLSGRSLLFSHYECFFTFSCSTAPATTCPCAEGIVRACILAATPITSLTHQPFLQLST